MKKYFEFLSIFLIASILILNAIVLKKISSPETGPDKYEAEALFMKDLFSTMIVNENFSLKNPLIYKGNNISDLIHFFETVDSVSLVFRFSGESCNVCIDFVIGELKKVFGGNFQSHRIILLGSNINERVKSGYYGKPVFSLYEGSLGLPFEDYNIPFLFVMDHDRLCKMFFIPEKSIPDLTDEYLNEIKNRYFN